MSTKDINIIRDTESDILYVIKEGFGDGKTINISMNADVLFRCDIDTKQVVGLTLEDFSKVMPQFKDYSDYKLMEAFDVIIDFVNDANLVKC